MAVQKHICAGCLWLRHSCKKHYLCFYNRSIIWGYSYSTKHLRWLQDGIADFKQVSYSRQVLVTKFKCLHLLWQPLLHLWVWMRLCVHVCVCARGRACVPTSVMECVHQTLSSRAFMALWALEETPHFPSQHFPAHTHSLRARSHARFVSVLSPPPVAGRLSHYLTESTEKIWHFFFVLFNIFSNILAFAFPCCHDDATHCTKMPPCSCIPASRNDMKETCRSVSVIKAVITLFTVTNHDMSWIITVLMLFYALNLTLHENW